MKDIVTSVLEGQGVGFWKLGRVKTLMEDENYRNFVVSRLNTTLDRKLSDEDMHLEDVVRWSFHISFFRNIFYMILFEMIKLCFSEFVFFRLLVKLFSKGC